MRFTLRIETPTHIGDGEHLSWLDYHLHGPTLQVLNWGALLEAASLVRDDVAERLAQFCDASAKLLSDTERGLSKMQGGQRADALRRVRDLTSPVRFAEDTLGNEVLGRAIKAGDYDAYRAEFLGGRLDRRLEIRTQAKAADRTPTVPATALRGQIRSALMHVALASMDEASARAILGGGGGLDGWDKGLADATPGRARFLFGAELEAAVFRSGGAGGRDPHRADPRLDLMQFIRVSEPVKSRAALIVTRMSPFQMSKTRAGAGGSSTQATPLQPLMVEAIDQGAEFEYELAVDGARIHGLAAAAGKQHAMVRDPFWAGFSRLFGVSREEAARLSTEEIEQRVLSAVEVALSARMAALVQRERRWFENVGVRKDSAPSEFIDGIAAPSDAGVPLRLGFGAGLLGLTAIAALESHTLLSEPLSRILARTGLGLRPRDRRDRAEREKTAIERARRSKFLASENPNLRGGLVAETRDPKTVPKSRRLVMEAGGPAEIPGYARLRRGEMSAEAPAPRRRQEAPAPRRRDELPARGPKKSGERQPAGRRERPGDAPRRKDKTRGRPAGKPSAPAKPAPRRPALPDRPATTSEIDSLLKRFGPRHDK